MQKKSCLFSIILMLSVVLTVLPVGAFGAPIDTEGVVTDTDGRGNTRIRINKGLTSSVLIKRLKDQQGNSVELNSLMPGDRVRSSGGGTFLVSGLYAGGELHHIKEEKLLTSCGKQVYFNPDVRFFLNGEPAKLAQLMKGFRVFMRIDPLTMRAGSVYAVDLRQDRSALDRGELKIWSIEGPVKNQAFRRGQTFTVSIKGTAGAKCFLDIPGVCYRLNMPEVKEGLYRGEYKISRADARQTRLVVKLEKNGQSILRTDPAYFDVAVSPPEIEPVSPKPDASYAGELPIVFARLSSEGSIIEPEKTQVYIDGVPLNSGLQRNVDYVSAELPSSLKPGVHRITIEAFDGAENRSGISWSFRVP